MDCTAFQGRDQNIQRWREISDLVSTHFRGTWNFSPLSNPDSEPVMGITRSDGVAISKASMPPMELLNSGGRQRDQVYHLTRVSQRSTLLIDGADSLVLGPGDLVFLSSGTRCRWVVKRPYVTSTIHVEEELLRVHVPDPKKILGRRLSCPFGLHDNVMHAMESALRIADDGQFERLGKRLIHSALNILSLISENDSPILREHYGAIDLRCNQIKSVIRRNFANPGYSVEDIAKSLQISPRYVQLALANEGCSPSEFVKKCRLEAASKMLLAPEGKGMTITQIALDCGFNSSSYFSTEFKRAFQVSPREYRSSAGLA